MPSSPPTEPAAFLRQQLAVQQFSVAGYRLGDQQVWLKKAGPRHGMAVYRVLGLLARLLRLPVLQPVPNLGGQQAIATEVRRLRSLRERGLRVPLVLAAEADGFLMQHLGAPAQHTPSLADEMHAAVSAGPQAVLELWRQGLAALRHVHQADACLSQAFARNMVRCPDGVVGYIDFEDDPSAVLPLPVCQVRDLLCYLHSTALYLRQSGGLEEARPEWVAWLRHGSPEVQQQLAESVQRLAWMGRLPQSRRWGRDVQRLRAAHDLMRP